MPLGFTGGLSDISARYGQTLVRGLEQSGAILSHGLQVMQTNRQLREFGSALSTINPESPDFPQRAISMAGNFPLAMQDRRGQAMLALDAKAHANWTMTQRAMDVARLRQSMRAPAEQTIEDAWGPNAGGVGGGLRKDPSMDAVISGEGGNTPSPAPGFSDRTGPNQNHIEPELDQELPPLPDAAAPAATKQTGVVDKVEGLKRTMVQVAPKLGLKRGSSVLVDYAKQVQRDEDAKSKPKPAKWFTFQGVAINPDTKETVFIPERPMTDREKMKIEGAEHRDIAKMDKEERDRTSTVLKESLTVVNRDLNALDKKLKDIQDIPSSDVVESFTKLRAQGDARANELLKSNPGLDVVARHTELRKQRDTLLKNLDDLAKSVKPKPAGIPGLPQVDPSDADEKPDALIPALPKQGASRQSQLNALESLRRIVQ